MLGGSVISLQNYEHTRTHTHTHTHTRTHAARWQEGQVRSCKVSPVNEHPAESNHNTKSKNPLTGTLLSFPLSLSLPLYRCLSIPPCFHSYLHSPPSPPPPISLSISLLRFNPRGLQVFEHFSFVPPGVMVPSLWMM